MFLQVTSELLAGFGESLKVFGLTLLFSIPLGLVICFGAMSNFKPLKALTRGFVWIIRGTPLMLQLFCVYYGPSFINWALYGHYGTNLFYMMEDGRFVAAVVAFVINYACYFSEIYRGGIESTPKGQYEAGAVLGLTRTQVFFHVILMQVIKRIMAPMSNEVITLVKDTSLARVLAVAEIFFVNETFIMSKGLIWPVFYIGVFFLVFVGILTVLFNFLEKKLSYYKV